MPGAPSAYTDEGPPERMIAAGRLASISATGMVDGTISLYTRASRTRRAMSWAYWAPKSTTSTVSGAGGGAGEGTEATGRPFGGGAGSCRRVYRGRGAPRLARAR